MGFGYATKNATSHGCAGEPHLKGRTLGVSRQAVVSVYTSIDSWRQRVIGVLYILRSPKVKLEVTKLLWGFG